MVIKQSLNVFVMMLLAFAMPMLVAGGGYLTRNVMGANGYLAAVAVLFGALSAALTRWLDTKGAKRFENL